MRAVMLSCSTRRNFVLLCVGLQEWDGDTSGDFLEASEAVIRPVKKMKLTVRIYLVVAEAVGVGNNPVRIAVNEAHRPGEFLGCLIYRQAL